MKISRRELLLTSVAQALITPIGPGGISLVGPAVLGGAGNALVPAGPAAAAALARLPSPPTTATRNKMVTAINALDAGGWWSKFDFFHLYASDYTQNSPIDLTGNGYTAIATNMNFMPRVGNQGNVNGSGHIVGGYTPATNGVNFTLNSASYGVMIANNRTTSQAWGAIGSIDTVPSPYVYDYIYPLYSDGKAYCSISGQSGQLSLTNSNGTKGFWLGSRTSSTALAFYRDGTQLLSGSSTAVHLSTTQVATAAAYPLGGSIGNPTGDTIVLDFAGAGFSSSDAAGISAALAPLMPASVPSSVAAAWGFTNDVFDWTPSGLSDVDTGLTNGPNFNWYLTQFWGEGNPSGSDITFSSPALVNTPSVNAPQYRTRVSTRGNTSSTFQGSISSAGVLTVTSMIGVNPTQGGTAYNNPILPGVQLLAGAGLGVNQPSNGIPITAQLSGSAGGTGTYSLARNPGASSSQVFNGYSSVGQVPFFSAGGFFSFTVSFDPTQSPAGGSADYPTLQMVGVNSLWGRQFETVSQSTKMQATEFDFLEVFPSVSAGSPIFLQSAHEETVATDYSDWSYSQISTSVSAGQWGNPTFTSPQSFQILWIPSYLNGGVGVVQYFLNGNHFGYSDFTYTASGIAQPSGSWTGNFAGNMFISESDQMVLQFDGGYGQPLKVYNVTVLQHP